MDGITLGGRGLLRYMIALLAVCLPLLTAAQVSAEPYRLRPFDRISITVYNEPQIPGDVQEIMPDGRISAKFAGLVEAAGKTTAELEADLAPLYKARLKLRDPIISVVVVQYKALQASIIGQVLQPGRYDDFLPSDTLFQLLSRGGGPNNSQKPNLKRATLTRRAASEVIPIDLEAMLYRNDLSQNYSLQDGDVLVVPQMEQFQFKVIGAVQRPGIYEYPTIGEYRLSDAIALAGGGIRTLTKFSEVLIIRRNALNPNNPAYLKANFVRLIRNQDYTQDILLQPGDMVYVSETKTPDTAQLGQIVNALFLFDRFFTGGFLGFRF